VGLQKKCGKERWRRREKTKKMIVAGLHFGRIPTKKSKKGLVLLFKKKTRRDKERKKPRRTKKMTPKEHIFLRSTGIFEKSPDLSRTMKTILIVEGLFSLPFDMKL